MWEKQDVAEEQPQATTLGDMLTMIAAHDQGNGSPSCEIEETTHGATQS